VRSDHRFYSRYLRESGIQSRTAALATMTLSNGSSIDTVYSYALPDLTTHEPHPLLAVSRDVASVLCGRIRVRPSHVPPPR
jgi:hypothetical protein